MYRKFLGRSKRIAAIALAGAMVFSSMTAYAKEHEQAVSAEEQQADATVVQSEQDKTKSTTAAEEKKTDSEVAKKEEKQEDEGQKEETKTASAAKKVKQETKVTEEYAPTATMDYKPHFTDYVIAGESLIGDKDLNLEAAMVQFGNAGTEAINLSDYEFKIREIENCENVDLKVAYKYSGSIEPGEEAQYSSVRVNVEGTFPNNYTESFAKFVLEVYAKNDLETLLYTTKEMTIYPYKIVTTDGGRVLKYNDSSHYSKYEVKIETDEHCKFEDLVGGGRGDSTEIWENGERAGIFLRTGYPSSFMMSYDEGYVAGSAKLDPTDAGSIEMVSGSGKIYEVDLHKPATLKVTSSTEAALEGEYGLKFVTDGNSENAGTLSGMEMLVKTYEDENTFAWLKERHDAYGEILAYETTVKVKDTILEDSPDFKVSIEGDAPKIYIPIPEEWDKEKIGVFYEYEHTTDAKTAEVSEDGKYVIFSPQGFDEDFNKVTSKVGIFEKIDPTVAKDWETVAYNYIETMRYVNWKEYGNVTFDQRFFEGTPKANDVAYMTYTMEREKYVENYRVGETYNLEIPYDVLVKDAAKYYKNVPNLKKTNMSVYFYYDAAKNAFIIPEGGMGDAPPVAKVKKVDELGNKTYAIRFEFKDNIMDTSYESKATLVVEDNGQGDWRYISFLKGYPEIAPIEPEKPEEYKPSASLKSGTWTGKKDIVIDVQSKGGTVDVAEIYYYKNKVSLGGVKVEADIQLDAKGNGTITLKNDKLKKATAVGAEATLMDWTKTDQLEVVVLFELGEESKFKNIYLPVDYKGDTEKPEKPTEPTPDKPSTNNPIVNPDTGKELSQTVVDKVVEKVENAKKGSEVVVKMQGATTVPSEVLKSVKGKDVDVVLDMGTYSWTINGKDVTANNLKDINLKVTMNSNAIPQSAVEKTASGDQVIQISLAYDGAFGFQADLKLNVGEKYKGLYAKLYYYNKEGKLEYVQSDKVEADGTVIFTFKHASDYAIILSKKDDAANTSPKTGDTSPLAIYVFMMFIAGGLAVFVGRRRFCK